MKLKWWHIGLFLAITLVFLAPLASTSPDGLERVAENEGFVDRARESIFKVMPDYLFPGNMNEALATIIAGLVGTILVFGLVYLIALWLRRQKAP